jgi:hypothetical protein
MTDPRQKNLDKNFVEEFDSELEEMINREEPIVIDDEDDSEELREWREWAISYENEDGDVID